MVKDLLPGSGSSEPTDFASVNGTLFFNADNGASGYELWKSDGTAAGTVLVKDIFPGGDSDPVELTNVNGTLFFNADNGASGYELWKSDGTAAGTVLVKDIFPGDDSEPRYLTNVNGTLFFMADDADSPTSYGLWKSDGTAAGTVFLKGSSSSGCGCPIASKLVALGRSGDLCAGRRHRWRRALGERRHGRRHRAGQGYCG